MHGLVSSAAPEACPGAEPPEREPGAAPGSDSPRAEPLCAAAAAVAAAWVAAGAVGLLAHPLRHALTWLCLLLVAAALWPAARGRLARAWLAAGLLLSLLLAGATPPVANVLAPPVLLLVACALPGCARAVSRAAGALLCYALYRLLVSSVPLAWHGAGAVAYWSSSLGGLLTGRPLSLGPSFAGLDFLLVLLLLYGGWLRALLAGPRSGAPGSAVRRALPAVRVLSPLAAILVVQVLWLVALAHADTLLGGLPAPAAPPAGGEAPALPWTQVLVRQAVPWNLLALPALLHLLVAAWLLRDMGRGPEAPPASRPAARRGREAVLLALAILLPASACLCPARLSLAGKRVVTYEKGFLNWSRAEHGQYGHLSVGMYGLLPDYLASLGASCLISPALSQADLAKADVVVLLFPDQPWQPGQLDRLWAFVRRGGTLLLFGEHTTRDEGGANRFNELLAPTNMRVNFDCGEWAVGGWLHCYQPLAHPATAGVGDDSNEFGTVIGASLYAGWPARPLLTGRWGFADRGDPAGSAMIGNQRYECGERLGDIVLAAEQPLGRGRIIAFGDTSCMTNGITPGSYVFTSRLLAYAAHPAGNPQETWRQVLALLLAAALAGLLLRTPELHSRLRGALLLALSLLVCLAVSAARGHLCPDGRAQAPNNVALLDSSHLQLHSEEAWRPTGLMGLTLTLMRSGFLVFEQRAFDLARLQRAGLVVSVAPTQAYSGRERRAIREFIENGGTFILTAGWDEARPSRALLAEYGLRFPDAKSGGPAPLGHFKSPYLRGAGYHNYVRFHAAWPLGAARPGADVIANGAGDRPVILCRRVGLGRFVAVGDTGFAMNYNLENEGGEPFEGMRENADFWRWLLTYLRGQPQWVPPPPAVQTGVCPYCGKIHGPDGK